MAMHSAGGRAEGIVFDIATLFYRTHIIYMTLDSSTHSGASKDRTQTPCASTVFEIELR